jgi:hypothetical protein
MEKTSFGARHAPPVRMVKAIRLQILGYHNVSNETLWIYRYVFWVISENDIPKEIQIFARSKEIGQNEHLTTFGDKNLRGNQRT